MLSVTFYHNQTEPMPLTRQDRQALDEFFNNFDVEQLSQLEVLMKTLIVPSVDPQEETAWMKGSFMSAFDELPY